MRFAAEAGGGGFPPSSICGRLLRAVCVRNPNSVVALRGAINHVDKIYDKG